MTETPPRGATMKPGPERWAALALEHVGPTLSALESLYERIDRLMVRAEQTEAQSKTRGTELDEAVAFREWVAEYAKVWREEEYGPTGEDLRHFVKKLHMKLASPEKGDGDVEDPRRGRAGQATVGI